MPLSFSGRAAGRLRPLILLTFVAACSQSAPSAATPDVADPAAPSAGATLRFDDPATLLARPSTDVALTLFATPGVTHATLTLVGAYEDASLSASEIVLLGSTGSTTLRTPSVAATFMIRASSPGVPDVVRRVSVSADGFATLRITPSYSGARIVNPFVASTFVHATCSSLLLTAPVTDGALVESGGVTGPIVIEGVPAVGQVAVMVRSAHYASGCTDLDDLVPMATRELSVNVYDLPLALTGSYATTFTFEPEGDGATAWQAMVDDAAAKAANAFASAAEADDAKTLIDAIRNRAVPAANRSQVDTTRTTGQWDSKAAAWLHARLPSLHDRAAAWLAKGRPGIVGPLTATLAPAATKGRATVTPLLFAGLPASTVNLTADDAFDWTADSEDTVHLSGGIRFVPSAVLAGASDAAAAQSSPASTTASAAIASQIDCTGLATALVGAGVAYPQCAAACLALHCANAVAALWSDAAAASPALHLTMTASGRAQVVDTPEPTSFDGAWVGDATAWSSAFGMKGRASGSRR